LATASLKAYMMRFLGLVPWRGPKREGSQRPKDLWAFTSIMYIPSAHFEPSQTVRRSLRYWFIKLSEEGKLRSAPMIPKRNGQRKSRCTLPGLGGE